MKRTILALSLAVSTLLYADYASGVFTSIYGTPSGIKGFANVQHYSANDTEYIISFSGADRGSTFNDPRTFWPYYQNIRIFIPAFTKNYFFYSQSYTGTFNMDVIYSLGGRPVLKDALPQVGTIDTMAYMAEANKNNYYGSDMNKSSLTLSSPYWLIGEKTMHNSLQKGDFQIGALNIDEESSIAKLNKWLYIATNTVEPSMSRSLDKRGSLLPTTNVALAGDGGATTTITTSGNYYPSYITISTNISLYKKQVDNYVNNVNANLSQRVKNSENNISSEVCAKQPDNVKNLCVYITSFGDDGSDTDYTTHINTVKNFAGSSQSAPNTGGANTTPTVTILSVSPSAAVLGQATTYTVSGSNLPSTLAFTVADADGCGQTSYSSSTVSFSCTSRLGGSKQYIVKDKSGGTSLQYGTVMINLSASTSSASSNTAAAGFILSAVNSIPAANVALANIIINESSVAGLSAGDQFKVAAPQGITFAAGTVGINVTSTSSNTNYETTVSSPTSTLILSIPAGVSIDKNDTVKYAIKANVDSFNIVEGVQTFQITSVNNASMAPASLKLMYIGKTLPQFTAAANQTIPAGGTGLVAPKWTLGNVTYAITSDNANGKISVDSTGKISVSSDAVKDTNATITITDNATNQSASTLISVANAIVSTLALKKGWNLVTTPANMLMPASLLNEKASVSVSGNKLVWVYTANSGTMLSTGAGAYTGNIAPGQGAWIKVDADTTIGISGATSATVFDFSTAVAALGAGFSIIGNSGAQALPFTSTDAPPPPPTSGSSTTSVKHAWGFMGGSAYIDHMIVAIPTGVALWIEK